MEPNNDHIKDRLRKLEMENLRLKAELEARKAGHEAQSSVQRFFANATTRLVAGQRLKKSVKKLVEELPGKPTKDTISDVLVNLVLRLTRIGVFAITVAAAPLLIMAVQTYILNRQNEKLTEQNTLLSRQNDRLDQQINLAEGSRRSSLVFFMSNIMDRMDEELRNNPERKLSDELIGRIVSLSQALRPYRYLENDVLTERQLSPERGQLLFSLINSNLHEETYDKIYLRANFNYADLQEANFTNGYMKKAMLAHSFFYKANFTNTILEGADLSHAYMEEAFFHETNLDMANLSDANLSRSRMENISARNADLEMADLREIYLEGDFSGCNLEGIIIKEATLANVDLRNCTFRSLAWLDSLRNHNLKGFASLVDYYEPVLEYRPNVLLTDTIYKLVLDNQSPAYKIITCNLLAKELVSSAAAVVATKKQGREQGKNLNLYLLKSPFEMKDLGVVKDSVFVFRLSVSKNETDTTDLILAFDPHLSLLLEMKNGGGEVRRELLYDKRLLNELSMECGF